MPSFLDYIDKTGTLPSRLTFSLAALMAFYSSTELKENALIGHRGDNEYRIMDDRAVLEFFRDHSSMPSAEFAKAFLGRADFFGQDLNKIEGLTEQIAMHLDNIKANGMRAALCKTL